MHAMRIAERGVQLLVVDGGRMRASALGWREVVAAEAWRRDDDVVVLELTAADGRTLAVRSSMSGWSGLLSALGARLPGAVDASEWLLLLDDDEAAPVLVYRA